MRLAQSYHAFGDSAPAKAEISGLMERLPMPYIQAGSSPMTSRTFSRAARKRDTASSMLHSPA